MPELPEVETVRRRLEPVLVGRRFERVEILDPRLTRPEDPLEVAAELVGERVEAVARRGKYVVIRFESGRALLVHLRMTGSLLHVDDVPEEDPHRRAVVELDDGTALVYRDVRRFGTWLLAEPGEAEPYLDARLGREPLAQAFTTKRLGETLAGRRAPVKAAILDQRRLDEDELRALHRGIRAALNAGIARQGATLRDYRTPDGGSGRMQHEFKVYGREGEPCERCGRPIEKIRAAGRGTWFCPGCQHITNN